MTIYRDIADFPEDERIDIIVQQLKDNPGKKLAFIVDSGAGYLGKAERYIAKIKAKLPDVILRGTQDGPVPNTTAVFMTYKRND